MPTSSTVNSASRVLPTEASPAASHVLIVSPLSGGGLRTLFSTHPPIEERIARLRRFRRGESIQS